MIQVYFNPDCSKCNLVGEMLEDASASFQKIEYLKQIPSIDELKELIRKLGITPFELIRKSEPIFIENFAQLQLSDKEWIRIMIQYPILIERPIVVDGDKAVICRPPEKLLEFLK